jgi:solute carrier family 25 carnitine/acylcarnitine transporter 20/29
MAEPPQGPAPPPSDKNNLLKAFLSGGAGGTCLVLAGHPFDVVKTRMQTAAVGATPGGSLGVLRSMVAEGGPRALFRGMSAPLLGVTPIFAVCFWAYGVGKDCMRALTGARSDGELTLPAIGVAGALSAVPTTAIMAPGERVKVLMVSGRGADGAPFRSPRDVLAHLARVEGSAAAGARALFRGALPTLLRDGTGSFAYFGVYEGVKRWFAQGAPPGAAPSAAAVLVGGAAAGVANWFVALPLDVIKSRMQASSGAAGAAPNMAAVTRSIVAAEGLKGLYRGLAPALLRAVPANAACFSGQENARRWLDEVM